jgi:hypothetical protein
MGSLGYEVVVIILAVVAAALIWSVINQWSDRPPQDPAGRSKRRE